MNYTGEKSEFLAQILGLEMLLHENILYLIFKKSEFFYIGNKPSNLETQPVFSFGSKSNKFKECKTHLLGKALSKNQNKMEKRSSPGSFPSIFIAYTNCFCRMYFGQLNYEPLTLALFINLSSVTQQDLTEAKSHNSVVLNT